MQFFPIKNANFDNFFPKGAISKNFPLLKVKKLGKVFHNFFADWGKNKFFWQNIHLWGHANKKQIIRKERAVIQPIIFQNLLGLRDTEDYMEITGLGEDRENRTLILRGVHDGVQVQKVDPAHRMDMSIFSKLRVNERQNKVREFKTLN